MQETNIIDRLYSHLHKLEDKSEQLMIGDFKQYVDEEWIDEAYEIISQLHQTLNGQVLCECLDLTTLIEECENDNF